jgi:hypothetical protein
MRYQLLGGDQTFSAAQVETLFQSGMINADTMVRGDGDAAFVRLAEHANLAGLQPRFLVEGRGGTYSREVLRTLVESGQLPSTLPIRREHERVFRPLIEHSDFGGVSATDEAGPALPLEHAGSPNSTRRLLLAVGGVALVLASLAFAVREPSPTPTVAAKTAAYPPGDIRRRPPWLHPGAACTREEFRLDCLIDEVFHRADPRSDNSLSAIELQALMQHDEQLDAAAYAEVDRYLGLAPGTADATTKKVAGCMATTTFDYKARCGQFAGDVSGIEDRMKMQPPRVVSIR